ncbi:MAG: hypothetical protein FWE67_14025 [Planctomycetaceae bacterium]|nr:hypothetical protein [Planctomycetaceae bacterium]
MLKIIATDEAGYGPNLGPLVITATEWNVDSEESFPMFAKELETTGFSIGDSKKKYHSGGSLAPLETVVLGANRTTEKPVAADVKNIEAVAAVFDSAKEKFGVQLCDVRSRIIHPAEFNELLDKYDSKGALLSEATMQLIQSALFASDTKIICDKHGGRNKYLALLQHYYPDEMFSIECESTAISTYHAKSAKRRLNISFIAKGETEIPIALSSMFSKYYRELAMLDFNAFWKRHIPELKPTAGYPEDAVRFRRDIQEKQQELGIPDNEIWRRK